jgi:hypothetical protein
VRVATLCGLVVTFVGLGCRADPPAQSAAASEPTVEPISQASVEQPVKPAPEPEPASKPGPPLSVRTLALDDDSMCIIDEAGAIWCSDPARFRDGKQRDRVRSTFTRVPDLQGATDLWLGEAYSCARVQAGVRCFGGDNLRELVPVDEHGFVETPDGRDVIALAGKHSVKCVVSSKGTPWCRGKDGSLAAYPLDDVLELELGSGYGCALLKDSARCWYSMVTVFTAQARADLNQPLREYCDTHGCAAAAKAFDDEEAAPIDVTAGARDIAVSWRVGCVLDKKGVPRCIDIFTEWKNYPPIGGSFEPTPIRGMPPLVDIEVSSTHACGRSEDGQVWCWGQNEHGQLGDKTTTTSDEVKPIRAGTWADLTSLVVDDERTCVVAGARVECWGRGFESLPSGLVTIPKLEARSLWALAESTCAELESGGWACWGGSRYDPNDPSDIDPIGRELYKVAEYGDTSCALENGVHLRCRWGGEQAGMDEVSLGRVVDWSFEYGDICVLTPRTVHCYMHPSESEPQVSIEMPNARAVAGTSTEGCVVDAEGAAHCWTRDWKQDEQLRAAKRIDGTSALVDVIVTHFGACGLDESGRTHCWGAWPNVAADERYESPTDPFDGPLRTLDLPPIAELVAGPSHACARAEDGGVWCWGLPLHGAKLGVRREPERVGEFQATAIASGVAHVCVLADGNVTCWGSEYAGQLARRDPSLMLEPQAIDIRSDG